MRQIKRFDVFQNFISVYALIHNSLIGYLIKHTGIGNLFAIAKTGITPDYQVEKATSTEDIRIAHRQSSEADIYFVANLSDTPQQADISFRISGKQPELWQAEDESISNAPVWSEKNGRTSVLLGLKGNQSVYVVFRKKASKTDHPVAISVSDPDANWSIVSNSKGKPVLRHSGDIAAQVVYASGKQRTVTSKANAPMEIKGPWKVAFAPKLDQSFELEFPELIDFSKHNNKSVNYFAGTATYRKQIKLDAKALGRNKRIVIDLGELNDIAEVRVNWKSAGVLWYPPYSVDITYFTRVITSSKYWLPPTGLTD